MTKPKFALDSVVNIPTIVGKAWRLKQTKEILERELYKSTPDNILPVKVRFIEPHNKYASLVEITYIANNGLQKEMSPWPGDFFWLYEEVK